MASTESWNGTAWTEVNDLVTARDSLGGSGADNEAVLAYGGYTDANTAAVEDWDGTNWSTAPNLPAARLNMAKSSMGPSTSCIACAGNSPGIVATTVEFTGVTTSAEAADITFD